MADPFLGEVRIFAGNFVPRGWAFCNGQTISIVQNRKLFEVLGNIYGGDGRSNFNIPDLQGRAPMHAGTGPSLSPRTVGDSGGAATVALTGAQVPPHNHRLQGTDAVADSPDPENRAVAVTAEATYRPMGNIVVMNNDSIADAGDGQGHNNMQPYLAFDFIIALVGSIPAPW